jgi:ABC-2 type transport system permease protein
MFTTVLTAMTLVREEVQHTILRVRLSAVRAWEMLLGVSLAQFILAAVIVPFTLLFAMLMGFHTQGSLLWSVIVGLLYTVSSIGLGLIAACFARSDGEAANLSAIIGVMTVLLSGAMYPMPQIPLFTIAGQTVQLYDMLPPAHATVALQRILLFGEGPGDFLYSLISLGILGIVMLATGAILYQRLRLKWI